MGDWARAIPILGVAIATAWPLVNYVRREQAETSAAEFLERLRSAQEAFRAAGGGEYASDLVSLISPCPGHAAPPLRPEDVSAVAAAGYEITLRPAASAESRGVDCHGRPTASDYYAAAQPRSPEILAQQAFATTASGGRIFVFFDGVAPLEPDMGPGGLATPLEDLGRLKIP